MDVLKFNKNAWNKLVEENNQWTVPVTTEHINQAKKGNWSVRLTPDTPVPANWFPDLTGLKVLALASGGGQQAPLFAAAGAEVTVFDNSPKQLEQDLLVAKRDNLNINAVEGDMSNLAAFSDDTFDFIFHPCSNVFVPNVLPVWKEAFRVLKPGGSMISGLCNPIAFAIDTDLERQGILQIKHKIPYSDATSISEEDRVRLYGANEPINFGHTLHDLIGGQIQAGFMITGFYEDTWKDSTLINQYINCYFATKAWKPL